MWLDLIPIALLGGLLGLDVVSFPQAMISRPLVAATLAGALFGDAASGLLAGATLELFALDTLPFGASRYPEWGSAAVVGGAIFARQGDHPAGALTVAVIAALATAWVGGWSMFELRQWNARYAAHRQAALDAGARGSVVGLQLAGLTADLLRGAVLAALSYAIFSPVSRVIVYLWHTDATISRAVVVAVAASVAGAAGWRIFHTVHGVRWFFVGGLVAGLLLMAVGL